MDYTTVTEVQHEFVTQLSTAEEPAMAKIITWSSRTIDNITGRRFYTSTGTEVKLFNNFPGGRSSAFSRQYGLSGKFHFVPPFDIASTANLTLEIAQDTVTASSSSYTSIDAHDYVMMPTTPNDGWPYQWVELKDATVGTYSAGLSYIWFPYGYSVIRMTGNWGWNATTIDSTNFPQELRLVAVELAVKAWRTRETGYSNVFGSADVGLATITRQLSPLSQSILDSYRRPMF